MARILIIDDSSIIREMLSEFLGELGHTVCTASQGPGGHDLALSEDFDLVICDIHLPLMNGLQVYDQVHAKKPGLPFVFTDSLPDELGERAREQTGQSYIRKPFDIYQLKEKLESILESIKVK